MKRLVVSAALCVAAVLPAQQPGLDVEHYDVHLVLPRQGKRISADVRVRIGAFPPGVPVRLDLHRAMIVSSVRVGCGEARETGDYTHEGDVLAVRLTESSGPACIDVRYSGAPADGLIIGTDSAGRWIGFGDNFPNRARYWLPTNDHPSDKATVTWEVTVPSGRSVVANGERTHDDAAGPGERMITFTESRAIPTYAMVIAAGPLVMHDLGPTACGFAEGGGCVPQMIWTAPEQAKFLPGNFARAGEIVGFFARTFGAFPYEKLAHLQTTTRYGGMENSSAIFYADAMFRRPGGVSEGIIAHETAHQWFGDAVTEREWAHAWLSEGFATFLAALWTQDAHGDSAYHADLARMRREVLGARVTGERAVIDSVEADPNRLLNENTYQKGGFVLQMLRTQLGDRAFFAGLRSYFADHKNGNAMTQDLRRALEQSSQSDLGWFFDQWLRRPGWAQLRTAWHWDADTRRVTLEVEQSRRFGAYRLPLTIDVMDASGGRRRVTVPLGAVPSQRVMLPGEFAAAPRALVFDPDVALLAEITAK